ncbi:hypothetical protein MHYP_G00316760 [Metynnis hypsauchen]
MFPCNADSIGRVGSALKKLASVSGEPTDLLEKLEAVQLFKPDKGLAFAVCWSTLIQTAANENATQTREIKAWADFWLLQEGKEEEDVPRDLDSKAHGSCDKTSQSQQ